MHTYVAMTLYIELLTTPLHNINYVAQHEKVGLMCTLNLTTFLDFKLK